MTVTSEFSGFTVSTRTTNPASTRAIEFYHPDDRETITQQSTERSKRPNRTTWIFASATATTTDGFARCVNRSPRTATSFKSGARPRHHRPKAPARNLRARARMESARDDQDGRLGREFESGDHVLAGSVSLMALTSVAGRVRTAGPSRGSGGGGDPHRIGGRDRNVRSRVPDHP